MNRVLLSIKTDPDTKKQLQAFAAELGVSSTAFVNMVVKQALRERKIILSEAPLQPTPYLEKIMRKAEADRKAGRNYVTVRTDKELADLFAGL